MLKPTPSDLISAADDLVDAARRALRSTAHDVDAPARVVHTVVDELAAREQLLPAGARNLLKALAERIEAEV